MGLQIRKPLKHSIITIKGGNESETTLLVCNAKLLKFGLEIVYKLSTNEPWLA